MARPSGETHHAAKMTLDVASKAKQFIAQGATVQQASAKWNLPYQTVYRLAHGITWAEAKPQGNVINGTNRGTPGRVRTLSLWKQHLVWKRRRVKHESAASVAKRYGLSKPSVRRLAAEFERMLASRVSHVQLTSGSYDLMMDRYGLSQSDCERLDELSQSTQLSSRERRTVAVEFASLEKKIRAKGKRK